VKYFLIINTIFLFLFFHFTAFGQVDTTVTKVDTTGITSEVIPAPVETVKKEIVLSETASMLCARWDLSEYRENGKVQELPNYEIEFFPDGKYNAMEESDYDEGWWIMSEDNSKIIFDEGTQYQEEWTIVNADTKTFKIRFTSEGQKYEYTFVPYVEWKP